MAKGVRLSDADLAALVAAVEAAGGNVMLAGRRLKLSSAGAHKQLHVAIERGLTTEADVSRWREQAEQAERNTRESFHAGRRLPQTADDCWALLDDFIGRTSKANGPDAKLAGRQVKKAKQPDTRRIVVAGDFHAPFQDNEAVAELIRREHGADLLILNGDLQDFYAISRFIKYERVSVESELAAVDALLGQLSRAFPAVTVVAGNHDHQRFEKQLRDRLSPEMVHVIEFLTGGNMSVIRLIAKRYPNIRLAGQAVGRHTLSWFHQEGDLLCTHAEKFSSVEGSVMRALANKMQRQAGLLGLSPWSVCVQAHTHQFGILKVGDKLMVEGGCMSGVPGYALTAGSGQSVQTNGYVTLTQTDGVTDWNSVRFVHLADAWERVA
jgi:predicted phosphodiesterase